MKEMLAEYDFSGQEGVRGKYYRAESVNRALRGLIRLAPHKTEAS